MLYAMIGRPGGGKSYEAVVYHVLPALRKGRKVITNLPLIVEMFAALDESFPDLIELRTAPQPVRGKWLPGFDGPAFRIEGEPKKQPVETRLFSTVWDYWTDWRDENGKGPLFVIDECQLAIPKGKVDPFVSEWFSLHRHYNCDVLLLTQTVRRVDPAMLDLVQVCYTVAKASAFGFDGKYIRKVMDGYRGEVVNTSTRTYDKRYFGLYKSHTQGQSVKEEGVADMRPIWKTWPVMGAGMCFAFVIVMAATGQFNGLLTPKIKAPAASAAAPLQPPAPGAAGVVQAVHTVPVAPPPPVEPTPSVQEPYGALGVHLTGSMTRADGTTLYTLALSRQGSYLYAITDADLTNAGYEFKALGHCVGELSWGKVRRVVVCDTPQVSLALGSKPGSAVKTATVDQHPAIVKRDAEQAREGSPLGGSTGARSAP